jgi:CheY-like chemotaxis protein
MPLTGVRVLCVDDDLDTCELLATVLQLAGAAVTTALSVRDALSAFDEVKPNVLISDTRLATESGYQLIRKIRALPKEHGGQIPAIAVTGYVSPEDRQHALSSGFQVHLAKPIDPNQLVAIVAKLLKRD